MHGQAGDWREHTAAELRRSGHRGGGARAAVVDLLSEQDCCLSAQEIYDGLRADGRRVGIASVYRVLDLLAGMGLVQRVDVGDGVARFEAAHPAGDHHHHLICDTCARVVAFEDQALERALDGLSGRIGHRVDAHDVTLRGRCSGCAG